VLSRSEGVHLRQHDGPIHLTGPSEASDVGGGKKA
jgi:hypothetical protein